MDLSQIIMRIFVPFIAVLGKTFLIRKNSNLNFQKVFFSIKFSRKKIDVVGCICLMSNRYIFLRTKKEKETHIKIKRKKREKKKRALPSRLR